MTQVVVRLPDDVAASLDELVASGGAASRSEAVRQGLALLLDARRRAATGAAIVAGYRASPQLDDDGAWADEATLAMIADEPW